MPRLLSYNVIVLLLCLLLARAEKVMRPTFKDFKIWADNKHVSHSITFDANDPHLNFTVNVLQDVPNVDIQVEMHFIQKLDSAYFFSANTTLNLCRILSWRAESPIGTLIHNYMKDYGNLIESCPVAKGEYFVHKFWYPEDTASALLPEINFDIKVAAHMLDANKHRTLILSDHITGEGVIQDVANVKRGIFAMLPKAG